MAESEPSKLSFLHLWDSWEALAELEARSKRTTDIFSNLFREHCNFSATNAKVFGRHAQSGLGNDEIGSFQTFLHAFKGLAETFAANHEILANSTNEIARKPSDALSNYLSTNHTRLSAESARMQKDLAQLSEAADKARQQCERVYRQCEQARQAAQTAYEQVGANKPGANEEDAQRLRDRYHNLQRELSNADTQYVAAVKAARTHRVAYDARMSQLLAAYEQIETARQTRTVKMARQFLQAQETMLISLQRNVRSVISVLDDVNPDADIQSFISQHASLEALPPLPAYVSYGSNSGGGGGFNFQELYAPPKDEEKSDDLRQAESVFRSNIDTLFWSARKESQDDNLKRVAETSTTETADSTNQLAPPQSFDVPPAGLAPPDHPYELLPENLNEMAALLRTSYGRSAFGTVLNQRRAITGLPARAFDTLEYLVKIFLDEAHEKQHTQPAKVVMILSQTFYRRPDAETVPADGPPPPREYLHSRIFHHALWRDLRFWRESFFDSVRVELCKHEAPQKWHTDDEQAEATSRTKQCVFSQMATLGFNLKEFSLEASQRRSFIESMSAIYELDAGSVDMLLAIADGPTEPSQ